MDLFDDEEQQPAALVIVRPYSRAHTPALKSLARTIRSKESNATPQKNRTREEKMRQRIASLFELRRSRLLSQRLKDLPLAQAMKDTMKGDEHLLKLELKNGYNPNLRDPVNGRNILHEACAAGHYPIVRTLLMEYDMNIDKRTMLGRSSALHLAVEKGFRRIVSILLGHGADFHAVDDQGCTPLHLVNKISVAKVLLKYAVNRLHRNKAGRTPLDHYIYSTPVKERDKDLVELLKAEEDKAMTELTRERLESLKMAKTEQQQKNAMLTSSSVPSKKSIDKRLNSLYQTKASSKYEF